VTFADAPLAICVFSFVGMALSAWAGAIAVKRNYLSGELRQDFEVVKAAALTLLALIIGFSFAMATSRYDKRKSFEEAEANAIGTQYLRADLLPAADAEKLRTLLRSYTKQRILFYTTADTRLMAVVNADTVRLQGEMWRAVAGPAATRQTPVIALAVSGMNDVINAQGYTQAAWWDRIPVASWILMIAMSLCANFLVGVGARSKGKQFAMLLVLPFIVSIAFLLIADIDAPQGGFILVAPQNLQALALQLGVP
jgi:hypothetical protein